ncbi:nucleoside phosphorylase [Haloferacaceae archaeon DSL9]
MSFPNYPDKHAKPELVTPDALIEYFYEGEHDVPETVFLCFHDGLYEYVTETHSASRFDVWGEGRVLDEITKSAGVVRVPGVGAPVTALVVEELIARGTERFCVLGHVGSLQSDVTLGEFVVVDRAIRDEGTSHHYVESERFASASVDLRDELKTAFEDRGRPYHFGATWTTDAVHRETTAEVRRYRREGILTVDMEAAAVFTVANYRGAEAGAVFTISDYLDPDEWTPRFDDTQEHLEAAFEIAVEIAM